MNKLILPALLILCGTLLGRALAQSWNTTPPAVGVAVATCGTLPSGYTYTAGQLAPITLNTNGQVCVNQ